MSKLIRRSFLGLAAAALPLRFLGLTQTEAPSGTLVAAGQDRYSKNRRIPTGSSAFKVSTQDTHGGLFAMEHNNDKKGGPPAHLHHNEDEWFYVIEGEYLVQVGTQRHHLKAGDSVLGPREVPHAWAFVGTTPGRLLISYAPAGKMEAFFDGREMRGGDATYSTDAAMYHAWGMELVGPPLPVD